MATSRDEQGKRHQPQTTANPVGEPMENPFENQQSVNRDIEQAGEEVEKEQQLKEMQTERD